MDVADTSLYSEPKLGPPLPLEELKPSNYERNLVYGLSSQDRYGVAATVDILVRGMSKTIRL